MKSVEPRSVVHLFVYTLPCDFALFQKEDTRWLTRINIATKKFVKMKIKEKGTMKQKRKQDKG